MTKKVPKEQRKEDIIEAAVSEFIAKGYEGASMQAIAARAGLTKGGLYYHFTSKDEILIAANGRYLEPILELIKSVECMTCPVEGLRYYIRNYLGYWSEHSRAIKFTLLSLSKILASEDMWPMVNSYSDYMLSFFESVFTRGMEKGKFREHHCGGRALALFTALEGVTPYLFMNQQITTAEVAAQFEEMFIDELLIER